MLTNTLIVFATTLSMASATYRNCPADSYFNGHECQSFCEEGFTWTGRGCESTSKCIFYNGHSYRGHSLPFAAGKYDYHYINSKGWNDRFSSYKITKGYYAYVCEHDFQGFQGLCMSLTGNGNVPRDLDNQISSVRCAKGKPPAPNQCVFYDGRNYGHNYLALFPGKYPYSQIHYKFGWNDRFSSYKIAPGYYARVCEHDLGQGTCITLSGNANLPSNMDNPISSVKCVKGRPNPTPKVGTSKRQGHDLYWTSTPQVPEGTLIKVYSPKLRQTKFFIANKEGKMNVRSAIPWFHSFTRQPFEMSFIINQIEGPKQICRTNTPIGLDIDNSGKVETVKVDNLNIDLTGNGVKEQVHEWFAPTEGILIDTSVGIVDGVVTGAHLFGDMGGKYLHGFEKLALRDMDGNNLVEGTELKGLAVWVDSNSNGHLDDGELKQLKDYGIVSLSTEHIDFVSSATTKDNHKMVMEDLWFA